MKAVSYLKIKWVAAVAALILCVIFVCPGMSASADDKTPVPKPQLDVSIVYDGTPKTVELPYSPYYTSEKITCVNAGDYTLRVSLRNKNLYCWDDMTTADLILSFTVEKALFDAGTLTYENETYVYDGENHFIRIQGLPASAEVVFNTVKNQPGIYPSVAQIDLGSNYSNNIITLDGATLTILAVELYSEGGYFVDERGMDPRIEFSLGHSSSNDMNISLSGGEELYATYTPYARLNGEQYDFGTGEFSYRVLIPSRYVNIKVYTDDNGSVHETDYRWNGTYVEFDVDSMCRFAVLYAPSQSGEEPRFLWLEILLGAVIIAEAVFIVTQALALKKLRK